jgi:hypothetical protein
MGRLRRALASCFGELSMEGWRDGFVRAASSLCARKNWTYGGAAARKCGPRRAAVRLVGKLGSGGEKCRVGVRTTTELCGALAVLLWLLLVLLLACFCGIGRGEADVSALGESERRRTRRRRANLWANRPTR